jgi:hypothetical protein
LTATSSLGGGFGVEAAIGIGLVILSAVIIAGIIRTVSNNLNLRA